MAVEFSNWSILEFLALMRAAHFGTNGAKFHLANADFTFDPVAGVSQFSEATFDGYAPVEIQDAPFSIPGMPTAGTGTMAGSAVTWTRASTGFVETIYGWWLALQDDSEVIMAERITPTVSLTNAGEQIKITPTILDCPGSCS